VRYLSHEIAALCPPHEQIRLKNFDQAGRSVLKPPPPLELAGRETVKQHVTTRLRPILVNDLDHEADAGVIGCDVNEFDNTRVSNKLFECMAEGIPIVATDMAPTRRIIEEVGRGRIIPRGRTPREVARIFLELRDASEAGAVMGARGQRAIVTKYNWESEFVGALRTIQELHDRSTGRDGAQS